MTYSRVKRIHYSPGGGARGIVCGVYKRGGRRVRFTRERRDITCDHCQRVLDAKERTMSQEGKPEEELPEGFDPKVVDTLLDAEEIDREKVKSWITGLWPQAKKLAAMFYRKRFEELFRHIGADKAECRGCSRTIFWVVHKNGKRTPYTVDGQNHFIDCPARDMFRKPR